MGCSSALISERAIEQSLAADGAIACFSSSLFSFSLEADRAPQLKANVGWLLAHFSKNMLDAVKSYFHRISERQKSDRPGRRGTVYTIFHNTNAMKISWLTLDNERGELVLAWQDTRKIEAFKRDLYAIDLICLAVARGGQ